MGQIERKLQVVLGLTGLTRTPAFSALAFIVDETGVSLFDEHATTEKNMPHWREVVEYFIIGGLVVSAIKLLFAFISHLTWKERCSFESTCHYFRHGGRVICNYRSEGGTEYGLSNHACNIHYWPSHYPDGGRHEMLKISVPLYMRGWLLIDFVDTLYVYVTTSNEAVDKELLSTFDHPTHTQWHTRYILEAVREAVKAYDER